MSHLAILNHWWVRVVAVLLLTIGLVIAVTDQALGWFMSVAIAGGALSGVLMLVLRRRLHATPLAVPDSFARDGASTDIINIAHVRVAGVGGFLLLVMAAVVALQFPQVGVSLALGLLGGALLSVALISYRRHHHADTEPHFDR